MKDLLGTIKLYLRVDHHEEDSIIQGIINAGVQYIENGTGVTFNKENAQHMAVLQLLCSHWYDHRNPMGNFAELPYMITAQLIQIEHAKKKEGGMDNA